MSDDFLIIGEDMFPELGEAKQAVQEDDFVTKGVATLFDGLPKRTVPSYENARFEAMRAHLIKCITRELDCPAMFGYFTVGSPIDSPLIAALVAKGFHVFMKPGSTHKYLFFLPDVTCKLSYAYEKYVDCTAQFGIDCCAHDDGDETDVQVEQSACMSKVD